MPRLADAVRVRHAILMIAMALVIWPVAVSQTAPKTTRQLLPGDLETLSWRSIGPANMGGRVAAIALAPSEPKTFYVGYATGGVWKTTNNGTTYAPVFDKYETSSIGAIAVCDAPENWPGWAEEEQSSESDGAATDDADKEKSKAERGKSKIIWVGTGEGNNRNSSSWGHGVYRSTNGGGEFTCVGLEDSHNIPALAVDPNNPDVCYVAALGHLWGFNDTRGVYKTADGGKNWQRVLFIDNETGACDVVMDPRSPNTIYAAMYRRVRTAWSYEGVSEKGGIYKSTDAGATWTKLTDGLPAKTGRIGIGIYHDDPSIVMAVIESDEGGWIGDEFSNRQRTGGVFRSNDGGAHWSRTSSLNPRSFYFSRINIDQHDSNRVYLLGWELYVSDDGGQHFRAGSARVPHVDFHAMAVDPRDTDRLFIGNDGGFYISEDRGETWDFQNNMPVGQFYNIALDDSDPYRIGGGLQDNGSWIGPSETITEAGGDEEEGMGRSGAITNADWQFVYGGDGFYVAFDAEDKNIIYAEAQGGYIGRVHLDTGAIYTLKPADREGQQRYRFNWNAPFIASHHDPKTLYLGGNVVFKLTDRGNQWTQISDDLSTGDLAKMISAGSLAEQYGTIVSLAESPVEQGVLWAGTDDGKVHMTRDEGGSWKDVTPAEVNGMYVSRIEPSHSNVDTAYVTVDGHRSDNFSAIVLITQDGGATWTDIKGDLPDGTPVDVIREDPRNPNVLYIGTETAAYVTIDRGVRWVKLNGKSLPTVAVEDLKIHPREMDLVAGTHGRSIYILDDVSAISQLNNDIVQEPLHVFTPMPGKPRYKLPYGGLWSDSMFIAENPKAGAYIYYWLRDYSPEPVKIVIKKGDHKVVELTGSNRPGLNRVVWDLLPDAKQRLDNPHHLPEFVPAGTYDVTVSQEKLNGKTQVEVLEAPGPVMP